MNIENQMAAAMKRAKAKGKATAEQITAKVAAFKPNGEALAAKATAEFAAMVATRLQALSTKPAAQQTEKPAEPSIHYRIVK